MQHALYCILTEGSVIRADNCVTSFTSQLIVTYV